MKPLTSDEKHKILREAYRHYLTWKRMIEMPEDGSSGPALRFIEHKGVRLSFDDLKTALSKVKLSERKKEAFYLNVIRDMKQKDVAEQMGITTVSVGQYVEAAVRQLAKVYFAEDEDE